MVWKRSMLDNSQRSQKVKKFQCLINTENELMIEIKKMWPVINAIKKIITNCNALNWQESNSRMPIRYLWERCILREKINIHRSFHKCKMKGINQCNTKSEYNMPSISAEEIKIKEYQNHFEHWNRNEYHFSMLYYEVKIEVYKKCKVAITWVN